MLGFEGEVDRSINERLPKFKALAPLFDTLPYSIGELYAIIGLGINPRNNPA